MSRKFSAAGGVALAAQFWVGSPTFAATFIVTRFDDSADGTCDADCSLREAVIAANASAGPDTVVLPAGVIEIAPIVFRIPEPASPAPFALLALVALRRRREAR